MQFLGDLHVAYKTDFLIILGTMRNLQRAISMPRIVGCAPGEDGRCSSAEVGLMNVATATVDIKKVNTWMVIRAQIESCGFGIEIASTNGGQAKDIEISRQSLIRHRDVSLIFGFSRESCRFTIAIVYGCASVSFLKQEHFPVSLFQTSERGAPFIR
jgi:hypothetical protein